jgi:hypothetical protein
MCISHLFFNLWGERVMDNIDIIYDELTRNKIDIDKQTLSFHINTILNRNRDLYREMNVDLEQLYREINITNVGRIFAYLTFVSFQRDSEESIRLNVRRCVEAFRMFDIPKPKRNKRTILVTLSLALIALYVSL